MRIVAHLDMDAFFASVEERLNPHLRGKPLAVGGDRRRRGVVSSANYAARKYGIHAGMPAGEAARRCPHLLFVEGNPQKYVHISLQILDVLKDFTPIVEPFSIDEAFLDLTGSPRLESTRSSEEAERLNRAVPLARSIQRAVMRKVDLTASIGIAPNKYIAKMASGLEKPQGLTVLTRERYRETFWPRDVQDLWGIGAKTKASLAKLGIDTIGKLAGFPREFLSYHFGLNGDHMQCCARGEDDSEVVPYYKGVPIKSMGHEFTLPVDLADRGKVSSHLLRLSDMVGRRMRGDGYLCRIVTIKLRDASFKNIVRQRALPTLTNDETQIFKVAVSLLESHWDGRPLRLIGVSVSGLLKGEGMLQEELFGGDVHRRRMMDAADSLRDRFGDGALQRAGAIE